MNRDAFLTRAQAATVTRVSADVIGKWHARGWVNAAGERQRITVKPGRGRTLLYRLGDILDAERDTRMKPNSRRGSRRVPAQLCAAPPASPAEGSPEHEEDRAHPRRSLDTDEDRFVQFQVLPLRGHWVNDHTACRVSCKVAHNSSAARLAVSPV